MKKGELFVKFLLGVGMKHMASMKVASDGDCSSNFSASWTQKISLQTV